MDLEGDHEASQQLPFDSLTPASLSPNTHQAGEMKSPLKHWASSNLHALPGGMSEVPGSPCAPGLQQRQHHGFSKHSAVERSGSSIPVLLDDHDTFLTTAAQQKTASDSASRQLSAQHVLVGNNTTSEQLAALPAEDSSQHLGLQHQQSAAQHRLQHGHSHQRLNRQRSHAHAMMEDDNQDHQHQPPQVLRRRNKSRLRLTQGGVAKGIVSLGKHRSGRVSPEKAALPLRQNSGLLTQPVDLASSVSESGSLEGDSLGRQHKLKTLGSIAMLPNTNKFATNAHATAGAATKKRPSMQDMLHSTLQQVQACTVQLQQQNAQQQQLQRSVRAMTAKTVAMLDQEILAALHAQQDHTVS